MRLRIVDDPQAVAGAAADVVAAAAARQPRLVLALPTGRTPVPFYDELAARHARGAMDLSRVRAFNLDELALPPDDPRTFRGFMARHAWGRTGLDSKLCHLPNAMAADLDEECERYEEAILAAGGIDLAILGLGADGHVAYNLPGAVVMGTHVVRLPDAMAASNDVPPEGRPLRAVTMGLGTIHAARAILVLATGSPKAAAVRALALGPASEDWPCTFLTDHPALEVLVDRAAAATLPEPVQSKGSGAGGESWSSTGSGRSGTSTS